MCDAVMIFFLYDGNRLTKMEQICVYTFRNEKKKFGSKHEDYKLNVIFDPCIGFWRILAGLKPQRVGYFKNSYDYFAQYNLQWQFFCTFKNLQLLSSATEDKQACSHSLFIKDNI